EALPVDGHDLCRIRARCVVYRADVCDRHRGRADTTSAAVVGGANVGRNHLLLAWRLLAWALHRTNGHAGRTAITRLANLDGGGAGDVCCLDVRANHLRKYRRRSFRL